VVGRGCKKGGKEERRGEERTWKRRVKAVLMVLQMMGRAMKNSSSSSNSTSGKELHLGAPGAATERGGAAGEGKEGRKRVLQQEVLREVRVGQDQLRLRHHLQW
jgi:hypothetical protein